MLVGTQILDRIDEIVERSYLDFTFRIIGDDFFTDEQKRQVEALGLIIGRRPLIELLYILARQRSTLGYRTDRTLNQLLDEIASAGILPIINDTHQYSIEHGKAQLHETIENTKREIKSKVKQEILKINNNFKNEVAVEGITSLPQMEEKASKFHGILATGLAAVALGVHKNFMRGFTTSFTNMANNAAVDEAALDSPNVLVYKRVINDSSLCPWCNAFYTDEKGEPKIYKLSELQANGSNEGKPKSAWRPVIGATHPRCRCQLHYVIS